MLPGERRFVKFVTIPLIVGAVDGRMSVEPLRLTRE
jgi:hypothetical protein